MARVVFSTRSMPKVAAPTLEKKPFTRAYTVPRLINFGVNMNYLNQHFPSFIHEAFGLYKATRSLTEHEIIEMAKTISFRRFKDAPLLNHIDLAVEYFRLQLIEWIDF